MCYFLSYKDQCDWFFVSITIDWINKLFCGKNFIIKVQWREMNKIKTLAGVLTLYEPDYLLCLTKTAII